MYCLESEWFSWPWIRPSSFCRTGMRRTRTHTHTQESEWFSWPWIRPSSFSQPWRPCCQPPASAPPSPPLYSTERGKRVVEEKRKKEKNYLWRKA
uniref:Uncharacterized protein n=1 Tax=Oncorhynchus tshawytscha TaxID=74940 RepID=A0AAZ3R8F0_ONCTS